MASTIFNKGILPVGAIEMFAGAITQSVSSGELTTTAPEKWALCDGSEISRTKYARLFEVIGTTYGSGDGSTTFNLPNLVGKFALGATAGGTTGTSILSNASAVGLPGLTPGIDEPYFFRLSAISFGCIFGMIDA